VFVAGVERALCGDVEGELIWQGRRCLAYNNRGKPIAPRQRLLLSHSGCPPMLSEFDAVGVGLDASERPARKGDVL
jgi:hypothetical protein